MRWLSTRFLYSTSRAGIRFASCAIARTSRAFMNEPKAGLARRIVSSANGSRSVGAVCKLTTDGGLDLSEVSDLTALVLIGLRDGKWRVLPTFWLPSEGLADKAVRDRVPYDLWRAQGFLQTTPGKTVSYEFVANYLWQAFKRYDIQKLAFGNRKPSKRKSTGRIDGLVALTMALGCAPSAKPFDVEAMIG
jgi:hypothetical protein